MIGGLGEAGDLFGRQLAGTLAGGAEDEGAVGDLLALGDQRAGADEAVVADLRAVKDGGAHADQRAVADGAAVEDGAVADGAAGTDRQRRAGIGMEHAEVLDVGAGAEADALVVAADHHAEPDADLFAQFDIADDLGAAGDKAEAGRQRGREAIEREDGHGFSRRS